VPFLSPPFPSPSSFSFFLIAEEVRSRRGDVRVGDVFLLPFFPVFSLPAEKAVPKA